MCAGRGAIVPTRVRKRPRKVRRGRRRQGKANTGNTSRQEREKRLTWGRKGAITDSGGALWPQPRLNLPQPLQKGWPTETGRGLSHRERSCRVAAIPRVKGGAPEGCCNGVVARSPDRGNTKGLREVEAGQLTLMSEHVQSSFGRQGEGLSGKQRGLDQGREGRRGGVRRFTADTGDNQERGSEVRMMLVGSTCNFSSSRSADLCAKWSFSCKAEEHP